MTLSPVVPATPAPPGRTVGQTNGDGPMGDLVDALCRQSVADCAPGFAFEGWPEEVDPEESWFSSPTVVSLNGTPLWRDLDEATRKRVSFWDAVAFFSANIHGEVALMQGITARLHTPGHEDVTPYLHHMLDEENKHSVYFTEFCTRYGGAVYPDRMLKLTTDPEESADFLFFARVYLFEDVVDALNRVTAADPSVHPVARWINAHHHHEERRHLAFGRRMVRRLWEEGAPRWPDPVREHAAAALTGYLSAVWKSLYNPLVYADAGLDDPWGLAAQAHASRYAVAQRSVVSRRSVTFLRRAGILTGPVRP